MSKWRIRVATLLTIAAMLAMAVSACGAPAAQKDAEAIAGTSTAVGTATEEKSTEVKSRTITFLTHTALNTAGELSGVIGGLQEEYGKTHPDFKLESEVIPITNLIGKIKTLAAGNSLPDVFLYEPGMPLVELIDAGYLVNLEDELTKMGIFDYVDPQTVPLLKAMANGVDNPLYGLPGGQHIEGIFYNKTVFKEKGLEVPETFDQLLDICKTIKDSGMQPFLFGGKDKWQTTRVIANIAARIMGYEAVPNASNGNGSFLDESFVKACDMAQDMGVKGYLGEDFNSVEWGTAVDSFCAGKSAMLYAGSFVIPQLIDEKQCIIGPDNVGFFSFPAVADGKGSTGDYVAHCGQVLVCSKSTYDEAVADWVKYIVTNAGDYALKNYNWLMGYKFTLPTDNLPSISKIMLENKNNAKNLMLWWETRMDSKTTDVAKDNAQLLLTGKMDSRAYLKLVQDSTDEFLKASK